MNPSPALPGTSGRGYRAPVFLLITLGLLAATYLPFRAVMNEMARDKALPVPYPGRLPGSGPAPAPRFKAGLVDSAATRAFFAADPLSTGTGAITAAWRSFLDAEGILYEVFDAVPETGRHECRVMILPAVSCASNRELASLRVFLEQGGGCIFTWDFGTRDEHGVWREFSGLKTLAGISAQEGTPEIFPAESQCSIAPVPWLTDVIPTGQHLLVPRYAAPMLARTMEPRNLAAGHWLAASPGAKGESEPSSPAMAAGAYRGGRTFWMGFNLGDTRDRKPQSLVLRDLMRQVILWTADCPQVVKPTFPKGWTAAAWTGVNVPADAPALGLAGETARRTGVRPVWFADPALMASSPGGLHLLADAGEVALLSGEGAADGWTVRELKGMRERLSEICGADVEGIRVEGALLDGTMDKISRAGFRYLVTRDAESELPRLVREKRTVPVFSRPRYLWEIPDARSSGPTRLAGRMEGRLFSLDEFCAASPPPAAKGVLSDTLCGLRRGWELWSSLKSSVVTSGGSGSVVSFSNTGSDGARDCVFRLWIPSRAMPRLVPSNIRTPQPRISPAGPGVWDMEFPSIAAGQNLAYRLLY
ncbi:MAG: hypothetical protein U1F77_00095 [Kiritimatiellia bacterium]